MRASFMIRGAPCSRLGLPWLDRTKAATVDPRRVTVPLLFVAAEKDRLVPPDVVRRASRQFAHVSDYVEYAGQGHWVLGQPGWELIADEAETWLSGKIA